MAVTPCSADDVAPVERRKRITEALEFVRTHDAELLRRLGDA